MCVKLATNKVQMILIFILLIMISFVILKQSPIHPWVTNDVHTDSSVFMTVAYQMQHGLIPYRDTFDHKGPVIYFINYLGNMISFYKGVWYIEWISLVIALFFIFKTSQLYLNTIVSALLLFPIGELIYKYISGGNLTEEYALPFISIAVFIFQSYFIKKIISRFRLYICGMSMGAVFLLRPNMIAVWVVFCIAVIIQLVIKKQYMNLRKYICWFMIGFLTLLLPVGLWLLINNAFDDFMYQNFMFNFKYCGSAISGKAIAFWYFLKQPMILFTSVISIFCVVIKYNLINLSNFIAIVVSLIFMSVSGNYSGADSYALVIVPVLSLTISASIAIILEKNTTVSIFILLAMIIFLSYNSKSWKSMIEDTYYGYKTIGENRHNKDILDICDFIRANSSENDRISVYGNNNIIYLLSERLPASKYSYQWPISIYDENIMKEYTVQLLENRPKFIIVCNGDGQLDDFIEINNYHLAYRSSNGISVYGMKQ